MPKKRDLETLEDPDCQEPMGHCEVEPMAEGSEVDWPSCVFSLDEDGRPTVTCPDVETQQEAVEALEENLRLYPDWIASVIIPIELVV